MVSAMPHITINGYSTYYEFDDFTPPWLTPITILIQHGMGRNSQFWRHWPATLGTSWPCIRRDLPGHGGSDDPGPDYPWTMDALVSDLVGFLDRLGLQQIHFLGESTAGMLGIAFAARYPERLRSLTLCASPTTIGPAAQEMFAFGHTDWQTAIRTLGSYGWASKLAEIGGTMGSMSPAQREWTLNQFGNIPDRALEGYSRLVSQTDVAPLLKKIITPTLILAPTRSAATPMAQLLAIQQALPGSQLVAIDGEAHEIYIDRASECMRALQDFLQSVEANLS